MITEPVQLFIVHLLLDRLEIYLREVTATLEEELGVKVTESAVCKLLKKAGFTQRCLVNYASQQSDDRSDTIHEMEYSLRGCPARAQNLLIRGERVSVIVAVSMEGVLECGVVCGGVSGDKYCDFICRYLLIQLYRADRSTPYGKVRLHCMRILYVHWMYTWLLDSRKAWAANIAIE